MTIKEHISDKSFAFNKNLRSGTHGWDPVLSFLSQALTAAPFTCCLFVGLFAFTSSHSTWKVCTTVLKSGGGHSRISSFLHREDPWLLLQFVSGHFKLLPLQYCISQSSKHGPVRLRIYPAITISTHIISKHQRPVTTTVTHAHVIRLPLPGLTDDLVCICLSALTFPFPNFSFMLF